MDCVKKRLSVGVLSYHANKTLARTLDSYGKGGLESYADEACIFFNELTQEDERLCKGHPRWRCAGSPVNLGLLGGMDALARTMTGDYLLMLQNDCPLIADAPTTRRYLDDAVALIAAGKADIVRCRSRTFPGQGFADAKKFASYHGTGWRPAMRRLFRPGKARRMIGRAPYAIPDADRRFPDYIKREQGFLVVDSAVINFTDQPFLVSRPLMLALLDWAKEHPKKRTLNGFLASPSSSILSARGRSFIMSPATYAAVVHASMSCGDAATEAQSHGISSTVSFPARWRCTRGARTREFIHAQGSIAVAIVSVRTLAAAAALAVFVRVLFAVRGVAVHVYSAVEVAVRPPHHRLPEHRARVAERDGKGALSARNLRHRVAAAEVAHRGRNGQRGEGRGGERCRAYPHRRLLRRTSAAKARRTAMYAAA